jgi:hypothetical protein
MTDQDQKQLGNTLWGIADQLRGAMNADDFRAYMLSFLFLRYLSDNYETAAQKELRPDYPRLDAGDRRAPLELSMPGGAGAGTNACRRARQSVGTTWRPSSRAYGMNRHQAVLLPAESPYDFAAATRKAGARWYLARNRRSEYSPGG